MGNIIFCGTFYPGNGKEVEVGNLLCNFPFSYEILRVTVNLIFLGKKTLSHIATPKFRETFFTMLWKENEKQHIKVAMTRDMNKKVLPTAVKHLQRQYLDVFDAIEQCFAYDPENQPTAKAVYNCLSLVSFN